MVGGLPHAVGHNRSNHAVCHDVVYYFDVQLVLPNAKRLVYFVWKSDCG